MVFHLYVNLVFQKISKHLAIPHLSGGHFLNHSSSMQHPGAPPPHSGCHYNTNANCTVSAANVRHLKEDNYNENNSRKKVTHYHCTMFLEKPECRNDVSCLV